MRYSNEVDLDTLLKLKKLELQEIEIQRRIIVSKFNAKIEMFRAIIETLENKIKGEY
jgi:hypothetical protein